VLNIGPALSETVEFFSRFRCKLYFVDLFDDLPELNAGIDDTPPPLQLFSESLKFPGDTRFDLCLFWDLFNFLDPEAIAALQQALSPHLHGGSLAHGFAVHNRRTEQSGKLYGVRESNQLSVRSRPAALPGYSPYNQGQLEKMLVCFRVTRSVLLPDSRLELLFHARF
jgi:hypothetical protein